MKKHKITEQDYLKAHRRASREEEIALHGRPTRLRAVHKSKKAYDRKREKAGLRNLPFSFLVRRSVSVEPSVYPCDVIQRVAMLCGSIRSAKGFKDCQSMLLRI